MPAFVQSNTQIGFVLIVGAADLTGKEGYLVELTSTGAQLPNADTDITPYVVEDGAVSGAKSTLRPLSHGANVRIKAKGTGGIGSKLVLAAVATAADKGKVRELPAVTGTYRLIGIAEEAFVDGQLVLVRPVDGSEVVA